jgi:exodeoxyribonuclease-3
MTWKISTWNVNGLRAVIRKKVFQEFLTTNNPDILCMMETKLSGLSQKALTEHLPNEFTDYKYRYYNISKSKKGYSGTSIWSKHKPLSVFDDMGDTLKISKSKAKELDSEGRVLTAEFDNFFLVSVYTPNSGAALERLNYRVEFWDIAFIHFVKKLQERKPVIVTGDLNCAYHEIDIHSPKTNLRSSGFTVEERNSFSNILEQTGLIDCFRMLHPKTKKYTYWSYYHHARDKNKGWRIDYFLVQPPLLSFIKSCTICNEQYGSDHCPIELIIGLD